MTKETEVTTIVRASTGYSTELSFNDTAMQILNQRYLQPGESPSGMLRRCCFDDPDIYEMLARLDFLPNTPTLVNLGTGSVGTLSACFKFDVPDDLNGILKLVEKAGMVLKWGGGVGYALSAVRPNGAEIHSTHRKAGGPVSFLPLYHALAQVVVQGGVRPGAQMAILSCDHPDILEFIRAKEDEAKATALSTFNISVAATDEFMDSVRIGMERDSNGAALGLFREMVRGAWRTGDPGCYFIDTSERTNPTPWLGKLTGTNPCGEVPLLDNEACNLGSINLGHFVDSKGWVDYEHLEYVARLATRYLDMVLDNNQFPDPAIARAVGLTRKLGLGVMGWADMLALLGIHYGSSTSLELAEVVSSTIQRVSLDESLRLGREKGIAPAYDSELGWVPPAKPALLPRNTTRTCIAPTGTIALIAGASGGIEPYYELETHRYMANGTHLVIRPWPLEKERGAVAAGHTPLTAEQVDWQKHVRMQGVWQKNVDLAVSKTINMPESAAVGDIAGAYMMAWEVGCKGITVYRNNSRGQQVLNKDERGVGAEETGVMASIMAVAVTPEPGSYWYRQTTEAGVVAEVAVTTAEVATAEVVIEGTPPPPLVDHRHPLPTTRVSITHKFYVDAQKVYMTVGLYPDGTPGELFIKCNREGSTVSGLLDTFGIMMSKALQYGVPMNDICSKLLGMRFEPSGFTGDPDIPHASSIIDYVAKWMLNRYGGTGWKAAVAATAAAPGTLTGSSCPDCGQSTRMEVGCEVCPSCGWSRC